jgi:hypothetical protein
MRFSMSSLGWALAIGVAAMAVTGCASEAKPAAAPVLSTLSRPALPIVEISWKGPAARQVLNLPAAAPRLPLVPVQASPAPAAGKTDATSAATGAAELPSAPQPEATSSASVKEEAGKAPAEAVSAASSLTVADGAAYCLKCHGPFEKVVERTKDYITEWDEHVNPHVYVPHDSKTIVDCTECHQVHAIPFVADPSVPKPTVKYCYSCHHSEQLVSCKTCHNE